MLKAFQNSKKNIYREKITMADLGSIDGRNVSRSYISYELINYTDKGKAVRDVPPTRICMTFRAAGFSGLCAEESRIELQRQTAIDRARRLKN